MSLALQLLAGDLQCPKEQEDLPLSDPLLSTDSSTTISRTSVSFNIMPQRSCALPKSFCKLLLLGTREIFLQNAVTSCPLLSTDRRAYLYAYKILISSTAPRYPLFPIAQQHLWG